MTIAENRENLTRSKNNLGLNQTREVRWYYWRGKVSRYIRHKISPPQQVENILPPVMLLRTEDTNFSLFQIM